MKFMFRTGSRAVFAAATVTSALVLSGCADLAEINSGSGTSASTSANAPAQVPSSAIRAPQDLYKVERVTPVVMNDAQLGWFSGSEGSPREVGAFVGKSVIEGLDGQFEGAEPVSMEVRIRQFQPSVDSIERQAGGRHALRLDFVLRDSANGSIVSASEGLVLDLVALNGTSAQIAARSGRTEQVRLAERIRLAAQYWAKDMNCDNAVCPAPVVATQIQPAAVTPVAVAAPAPAAVTPTPEPAAAPKPVEVTPEPAQQTVAAAPAPAPAPAAAPAPAEPAASSEKSGGVVAGITGFFGSLFAADEDAAETAAATPAPAAVEAPAAAAAPASAPAPAAVAAPAPAPAPVPVQQVSVAPAAAPDADGQFFKSPSAQPLESPQKALLGRKPQKADPQRRRIGDVVLEVANLPAYWDGDATTGGVWIALPYIPSYRKAVVTNPVTGQSVQANLFWRDPQSSGSSTLLSSAAAAALGVAPGEVANLGVKIVAAE
ncbi:MAG: DUF6778 family protein [Pikeienuella sp.]